MLGERAIQDQVGGIDMEEGHATSVPILTNAEADSPSGASIEHRLLSVADVRHATGITRKALRLYEIRGLVRPVARTPAGYRLYDNEALRRIKLVGLAKALGLTLVEAAELIAMADGCCGLSNADLEVWVRRKIEKAELLIQELVCRHNELRRVLAGLAGHQAADNENTVNGSRSAWSLAQIMPEDLPANAS